MQLTTNEMSIGSDGGGGGGDDGGDTDHNHTETSTPTRAASHCHSHSQSHCCRQRRHQLLCHFSFGALLMSRIFMIIVMADAVSMSGSTVGGSSSGGGGSIATTGNSANNVVTEDPEFTDVIENITVPAGRNVKLACSVKNLGSYKVAWMHFEQSAILTVHNHVITRNPRISVTHDKHDKHRTWFLHINNVQEEDKGRYMCQINTVTAKTQYGFVKVVVPPNIDDALTSSDVIVREGDNVTLRCKAKGSPEPAIKWKRDDGNKIVINKTLEVTDLEGEALELERISRLHMGAYLCIATNGVPPSVSKRIKVSVDFSPMVWIPHQLVGIPMYFNVTLECFIEANPTSLNYWTRENDKMISESTKYKTETLPGNPSYKATMRLTITNVQKSDYGSYKCVAKNPRGEMDGTIKLYMSSPPTTVPPPTTTTLRRITTTTKSFDSNTSTYGDVPTNSVIVIDKMGTKYQSNLNEIDKSEQKLTGNNPKGYDWSKDKNVAPHALVARQMSAGNLLTMVVVVAMGVLLSHAGLVTATISNNLSIAYSQA